MLCRQCQVGRYQMVQLSYFCWFAERIVITPKVPALECDVCGDTSFDPAFVQHIQLLIDRQAAPRQNRRRPQHPLPMIEPVT